MQEVTNFLPSGSDLLVKGGGGHDSDEDEWVDEGLVDEEDF